ncbi:hypothetical protein [Aeromonas salmonicida]|uniref:hypothetical protein n=1 Tax=Aeromonas salmonicida TaxID=645 RepID=UPI0038B9AE0B
MTFLIVMWLQLLIVAADPPHRQPGGRKPGNYRPQYSADWESEIAPSQAAPTASPSTTSTKLNKIKGHGNPVPATAIY